ncbi:MAG: DUF6163 family protein [Pseudomonadota bacterium]
MSIKLDTRVRTTSRTGVAELVYLWFVRLMAGICLLATLSCWSGLAGINQSLGIGQLGTQSTAVTALNITLAVLFPIAMLGLWLRTRWGVAVWIITLLGQIVAHTFGATIFSANNSLVLANAAAIVAWILVVGFLFYRRSQTPELVS